MRHSSDRIRFLVCRIRICHMRSDAAGSENVLQYRRCHRREVYAHICMRDTYTVWELRYSSTVYGYSLGARLGVARNHAATVTSDAAHNKRDKVVHAHA